MKSIRRFLLSRLLLGTAVVLAAGGLAVYLFVARSLEAQFDRNLEDRVQGFASILFQQGDEVEFEFSDELMPEYERAERPDYFELWYSDGRVLERSLSLVGQDLEVPGPPRFEPQHWTAPLPDGRDGRYVSQWVEVHHVYPEEGPHRPDAHTVHIVVARGREDLLAAERGVLAACALGSALLLGLLALLSWQAVERGLEPARRLAAQLDAVQVERLPEGLETGDLPVELEPMAHKADALIQRLDAAFKRERRTTADIAHELRTPISEVLTVAEVALRNGQDPAASRRALETLRSVAWRMGRSVSTLLKLARLEMGDESFERTHLDAGALVAEVLRPLEAVGRQRDLTVDNGVPAEAMIEGDEDAVRIIVSNLLSNALYYARPGGRVRLELEQRETGWSLSVENEAVDLRPEDMRLLSEPFWKKDGARTDRDRSGLGLGLSHALARKSAMNLTFALEGQRFRASLQGPTPDSRSREHARRRRKHAALNEAG